MSIPKRDLTTPSVTFTAEDIELWRAERDRLLDLLRDTQSRLQAVNQLLSAAAVLSPSSLEEKPEEASDELDPTNVMGTMVRVANAAEKPMTKADLKEALREAGVEPERIEGSYFYVALNRLKKKERITVLPDGRV
ncbi:MAG: hypothetical protein ABSF41_15410, partial [Pseudolabrys sp.]